MRALFA